MQRAKSRIAATLFITLALSASSSSAVFAQKAAATIDPARIEAAQKLIDATNGAKVFDTMITLIMRQMSTAFSRNNPGKSAEVARIFNSLTIKAIARKGEIIKQVSAVYAKRFTAAELTALADFYKSGVGAKFISQQQHILRESMQIGQRWGMQLGREVAHEAREELKRSESKK